MSDDLGDIQAIFFEECAEGLAAAEAGLSRMAASEADAGTIAAVFRAVHSIKGGSGAFGHGDLLAFSHRFENVLDEIRAGRIAPDARVVKVLLSAFDILSDHVAAAQGEAARPSDDAVLRQLDALLQEQAAASGPAADAPPAEADEFGFVPVPVELPADDDPFGFAPVPVDLDLLDQAAAGEWRVRFRPSADALANGGEPLLVLRELETHGGQVIAVDTAALPPLRELVPSESYLGWTITVPGSVSQADVAECFDFVPPSSVIEIERHEPQSEIAGAQVAGEGEPGQAPPAPPAPAEPRSSAEAKAATSAELTIRVGLSKLDALLNLVGELVIRNSILADRLNPVDRERVELPQLSRLIRQIQDSVMSLRAQPIQQAFSRVPRMLRDLSAETGKTVRLEVTGEGTEVDKTVIERIGDPLTHMIRNAVDHGIEPAERRLAAGKPVEGTIRLSAAQKGGKIMVRVADDGGGIDRDRVRAKAVEKGIVAADAALSEGEVDQLICAPGFSTAQTISNISGRGVGMDVVRSNIEALGGRVEISSVPGAGTTFTMVLPLTLAILDGMIVRLGGDRYVLPLAAVVESVQPAPGQVQAMTPTSEVIDLRGEYLPVRRLGDFFGLASSRRSAEESLVIVVESESAGAVGLMVDTIDDRREVVVKSLDENLHPVRGLGGATILGDGSIALILDVEAIVASLPRDRMIREQAA